MVIYPSGKPDLRTSAIPVLGDAGSFYGGKIHMEGLERGGISRSPPFWMHNAACRHCT